MNRETVLAACDIPGAEYGRKVAGRMAVKGGLHYLKGNSLPYFSITADVYRKGMPNQFWAGGACHDEILKRFPRFFDLVRLHLCDMYGAPMHAVANGLYNIAGAMGGLGQQYHVGNSERHFPCKAPEGEPWKTTEYRQPTPDECRKIALDHFRCNEPELDKLILALARSSDYKATIGEFCDRLRIRWKSEARACIARYGLRIYGDVDAWELKADPEARDFIESIPKPEKIA